MKVISYFTIMGLKKGMMEKGYLTNIYLFCQDKYKAWLDYFKIDYNN